jgi:hypothetical protein
LGIWDSQTRLSACTAATRTAKPSVKAPVRSPEPPHHKGSENPAGKAGDDNVNPLALRGGHRHFSLPQSSSASRFTAGASGFFDFSQSGERPERLGRVLPLRNDAF